MNHTPGPWMWNRIRNERTLVGGDAVGTYVLRIDRGSMGAISLSSADERLIAAAPDLLEACEAAQDWLTDGIAEGYPDSLRDKIEAAVARARGEA